MIVYMRFCASLEKYSMERGRFRMEIVDNNSTNSISSTNYPYILPECYEHVVSYTRCWRATEK
jgi:hypothetical protein